MKLVAAVPTTPTFANLKKGTVEKMQPLVEAGAHSAGNLDEGIAASPAILVCVDNTAVTRKIFSEPGAIEALRGKILVEMSTGTPVEAQEAGQWFSDQGVRYIDGAVLAGPKTLKSATSRVIFAGPEDAYVEAEPILKVLASKAQYLGNNIRSASAMDLAWLCRQYGMFAGVSHGTAICRREGVRLDDYAEVFPDSDHAHHFIKTIDSNVLENPGATLKTWGEAFGQIRKHAEENGIDSGFPEMVSRLFDRAIEAGYGELDVAALAKTLE